ncbi:MAG: hypothetical protein AAGA84_04480 [Pseudomonadota bacterium]
MYRNNATAATVLIGLVLAMPASASLNKSIKIDAGATSDGASSVNGNVTVGDGAYISGDISTVNGRIYVGNGVQAQDVESVNGRIQVGDDANIHSVETVNGANDVGSRVTVRDDVSTVNGTVKIGEATTVGGDVSAVNGKIMTVGTSISGDVINTNGGMDLGRGTRVTGDVVVRKPNNSGWGGSWRKKKPTVIIGPEVSIDGTLRLEREVILHVHESATIGSVEGKNVEMQRYSGETP